MLKFVVSDDNNWLFLSDYDEDHEKKQIEISLTKKIHNHYFHPLVKKKVWDGSICFIDKKLPGNKSCERKKNCRCFYATGVWGEIFPF